MFVCLSVGNQILQVESHPVLVIELTWNFLNSPLLLLSYYSLLSSTVNGTNVKFATVNKKYRPQKSFYQILFSILLTFGSVKSQIWTYFLQLYMPEAWNQPNHREILQLAENPNNPMIWPIGRCHLLKVSEVITPIKYLGKAGVRNFL